MKKLFIETYGCQMNFADSEVVASILKEMYSLTKDIQEADLILINTCSIRDKAEQRIHKRLKELEAYKRKKRTMQVGLLGCMAERMKEELLQTEPVLDFIAGPDAYRSLPQLIADSQHGHTSFNVLLSKEETYDNIMPVRYDANGVSAFVSIMRGCNNFCSYCVVPYTRGRERSRSPKTILGEIEDLLKDNYKEVTLLGQNVNSYYWKEEGQEVSFAKLMAMVAEMSPELRVRFATSHPKDLSDELIETIARYDNICKCIHLPVQSGSDRMLKLMNRHYDSAWYLERIAAIRRYMPDCSITTDVIAGFCTETEEEHQMTLEMFRKVRYDYAYMFKFSMRPNTYAEKHLHDDVTEEVKTRRLEEIIALQGQIALENNRKEIGKEYEVLVEGESHRSKERLFGRNSQNKVIVFERHEVQPGQYVKVKVVDCTAATLLGELCTQ